MLRRRRQTEERRVGQYLQKYSPVRAGPYVLDKIIDVDCEDFRRHRTALLGSNVTVK